MSTGVIAKKSRDGIRVYDSEALLTKDRTIWIFGEIDDKQAFDVTNQLMVLDADSKKEIKLLISSCGGAINDGLAIYDVMQIIDSPIRTIAIGTVASMASIILSAGDRGKREILPSARVMIHDPRIISNGNVMTASQVIELGSDLQETKNMVNNILAKNCNRELEEVNNDTLVDKYMSAQEAIEYGIVDIICERL